MLSIHLPRRRFLRWGAWAGSTLLASSVAGCGTTAAPAVNAAGKPRTFLVLAAQEAALFEQLGRALLPQGEIWPDVVTAEVAQRIDEELYFVAPHIQQDFKLALKVVDALPLLYGHFSFFSTLTLADQQACLRANESTRFDSLRAAVNGCRMAIYMVYFGHATTWHAMHYDGPHAHIVPQLSLQRALYRQ